MEATVMNARFAAPAAPGLFEHAGLTLEDLILGVWEDLVSSRPADCPVCGDDLLLNDGCARCGSLLS